FNLSATAIIFPVRRVRRLPVAGAEWIATVATHSRRWALFYVLGLFYGLPALLAFLHSLLTR
ncbi:MAG: Na/Pi cotransporter family protein, partial [Gemmatimonadales bacterium]|nr:Na/Pi cotransporter family protein [Gemmatimonadales bacterium]